MGESRAVAPFARALVTVRSAFHGNVEKRGGGTGEEGGEDSREGGRRTEKEEFTSPL